MTEKTITEKIVEKVTGSPFCEHKWRWIPSRKRNQIRECEKCGRRQKKVLSWQDIQSNWKEPEDV